jgi:hypothetical protein
MDRFGTHLCRLTALAAIALGPQALGLPTPTAYAQAAEQPRSTSVELRQLDVLIVLYTRSFSQTLTHAQLERVHEEVLEFVEFYRTAVGDAVDFRISLLQIDRELALAEISEVAPGRYYLGREDIEDELVRLGMLDYEFDEVIALYAWNDANPEGASLAYGGGAVGPDGHFLGDAGYNSIGVFAWDPGRISQIMIHEVLHNIDDMFSMSGMPDGFLNSDEMSRNMPTLLAERPGAFLPHYNDDEMINYAERERANRATYPWAMQLVYYGWILQRTPPEAWLRLRYGRVVVPGARVRGPRPLYERIFLSRANERVYLPVVSAEGARPPSAQIADEPIALERRTYEHTDFDGGTLFEGTYYAGWLKLARDGEPTSLTVGDGAVEIVPLGMGDLAAPSRIVTYTATVAGTGQGILWAEAREARFGEPGPLIADATLSATSGEDSLALAEREPGRFAFAVSELGVGRHSLSLNADAAGLVFVPRRVVIERRSPWRIEAESRLLTSVGTPLGITIRVARDVGARDSRVTARVGGRELELRELEDGRYSAVLDEGLKPGLDTVHVTAELPGMDSVEVLEAAIPVYSEPRGWIEVPSRIGVQAGQLLTLEARVRDRMGRVVEGAGLPVATVIGPELLMMTEEEPGVYRVRFEPPVGDHRIYVIGLEGRFERRVVALQVR